MSYAQRRSGSAMTVAGVGICALLLALAVAPMGCQASKTQEKPVVDRGPMYTGPKIFYGTVGSLGQLMNDEPMLVSGYGLLVGLNGTGSAELLPYLSAYMKDQARRGGLNPTTIFEPNTAVVSVQGLIPPGAAKGDVFDLWVEGTVQSITSLSGGTLYTADLQPGAPSREPAKYLGRAATGSGAVYMDPFDKQAWETAGTTGVSWQEFQRQGLVLGGGRVVEPRPLMLTLNQPSHSVAGKIAAAINQRFKQDRADKLPIAVAHDEQHVGINIPTAFRRDPAAFIEQVRWLYVQRLDPAFATAQTQVMLAALAEETEARRGEFAEHCVQAWKALDRGVLAALRPAYTLAPGSALERELWPEESRKPNDPKAAKRLENARAGYPAVRDAAVRAGASMGDPQALDILVASVAHSQTSAGRRRLAGLLAEYPNHQGVLAALRLLMTDKDTAVRVAAYEAYTQCFTRLADELAARAGNEAAGAQAAERFMGSFHRTFAYDQEERPKFAVDVVPLGDPLVVMTVSGRPRVVVFGEDKGLVNPTNAWFEGAESAHPVAQNAAARAAAVRELAAKSGITEAQAEARVAQLEKESAPIELSGRGRLNLRVRDEKLSGEMRETLARQIKQERGISFEQAFKEIPEMRQILAFSFYPGDGTKQEFKAVNTLATLVFTLGQHNGAKYALPGLSFNFDKVTRVVHELSKRGAVTAPVEIRMSPLAARMRKAAETARRPDSVRPETAVEDLSSVLGEGAKPKVAPAAKGAEKPKKDDAPAGGNPYKQ